MFISDNWHLWFIRIWSVPRVGAVLEVVVLELDLIFDLVDQNLRQEDANQLQDRKHKQRAHQLHTTVLLCLKQNVLVGECAVHHILLPEV